MPTIELATYPIHIGSDTDPLVTFIDDHDFSRVAILVDENTEEHCLPILHESLGKYPRITVHSGEKNKTLNSCQKIWSRMVELGFDRHALLINVGGGVIGDMGGFCASTFMRGIQFVQMPTTLLSQVDASVGGKLGVDFNGLKNYIGLFKDPSMVMINPDFLKTLSPREQRSGFAELIKHALIDDAAIWKRLLMHRDWHELNWELEIFDSVSIKKRIVEADPFERNVRKILNFGHSVGHAVETVALQGGQSLLHGEAVAIGMLCEAHLSVNKAGLSSDALESIGKYLAGVYPDLPRSACAPADRIVALMKKDKKNKNERLLLSLLPDIGSCIFDVEVSPADIESSLAYATAHLQ